MDNKKTEEVKNTGFVANTAIATITSQMKELVEIKEGFKDEQIRFIKGLVNLDLTDNELYMFLSVASKAGLNPFNKEIIAIVYKKDEPSERKVSYIVTRDGKRAVAGRKGGIESIVTEAIYIKPIEIKNDDGEKVSQIVRVNPWEGGTLWGAESIVKRFNKEYRSIVPLKEYNTGKQVWFSKPETMIKKVAESQALSQAVPELLGLYDETEMQPERASSVQTPLIDGGGESADDQLLQTLKVLGADMERKYTKQEAVDEIARLNTEKGKQKPKA